MTFSIVACDEAAQELGIAVASKFLSVGAVVPWVEAGAGAVATQALANTSYGQRGLALLREGKSAQETLDALVAGDDGRAHRQAGIVDAHGNAATFTGDKCIEYAGGIRGRDFAAQGNCLAGEAVIASLARGFIESRGRLAYRLLNALQGGQKAGGDKRGQQSAALIVCKPAGGYGGHTDRFVDLRVDDAAKPIDELTRILDLHALYFFPPEPQDILEIDERLGKEIVQHLRRSGRLIASDVFDENARTALVEFMHVENLEERIRDDGTIDRQTVDYLRRL